MVCSRNLEDFLIGLKMMIDSTKDCNREEDLFCIFNTIGLFLEHQNFTKTYDSFKEECKSRGFNKSKSDHKHIVEAEDHLQKKETQEVGSIPSVAFCSSNTGSILEKEPTNEVTYYFENDENEQEKCQTASTSNNTDIFPPIRPDISLNDYLLLKQKFDELQEKHRQLMYELEEKACYLNNLIPLIQQNDSKKSNQKENVSVLNSKTCDVTSDLSPRKKKSEKVTPIGTTTSKTDDEVDKACDFFNGNSPTQVYRMNIKEIFHDLPGKVNTPADSRPISQPNNKAISEPLLNVEKRRRSSSPNISSFEEINLNPTPTNSEITFSTTVSNSTLTRPSDYALLEPSKTDQDENRHHVDKVNFLFARKNYQQIQSAPHEKNKSWINGEHKRTKMCFSMPLSPRKHLPNNKYYALDFSKIKKDLRGDQENKKLLILQALRWRLTKCSYIERSYILNSFIINDLLDLQSTTNMVGECSSEKCSEKVFEGVSRLINVFASLKQGRDYLCSSQQLIEEYLIPKIKQQLQNGQNNLLSFEMLIVALQKLSIRKEQRKRMVKAGLLQITANLLSTKREELSTYCLEYSCALFMNLCLEKEAKTSCADDPSPLIHVFKCLLDEVQAIYMPYIGGALYSILSENSIKQEAVKQKIDSLILQQIQKTTDNYLKKQLEFIIRSRFMGEAIRFVCNENEPLEEVDLLEPELEQNDVVVGSIQGETVLDMYRLNAETRILSGEISDQSTSPKCTDVASGNGKATLVSSGQNSSIGTVTEITKAQGTSMHSKCSKLVTSRIKFDAEVSAVDAVSPGDRFSEYSSEMSSTGAPETITICNCLRAGKFNRNCGCYEAIKRSLDEEFDLPNETRCKSSPKITNADRVSLFSMSGKSNAKLETKSLLSNRNFEQICDLRRRGYFDCVCYREVFLSRPKLNRTPPLSPKIKKSNP